MGNTMSAEGGSPLQLGNQVVLQYINVAEVPHLSLLPIVELAS